MLLDYKGQNSMESSQVDGVVGCLLVGVGPFTVAGSWESLNE